MTHNICQVTADTFQVFCQNFKVSYIIGFIFYDIHGNISVCHFAKDASDILNCFTKNVTKMMDCLGNHANFIFSSVKRFQLPVSSKFQVPKTADGSFHNHQFFAFPVQDEKCDKYDKGCDNCT